DVFREKIRPRKRHSDRAGELPLDSLGLVMFEDNADVRGEGIEMLELFDLADEMVLDGFRQRDIMRHDYQIHANSMLRVLKKSTTKKTYVEFGRASRYGAPLS